MTFLTPRSACPADCTVKPGMGHGAATVPGHDSPNSVKFRTSVCILVPANIYASAFPFPVAAYKQGNNESATGGLVKEELAKHLVCNICCKVSRPPFLVPLGAYCRLLDGTSDFLLNLPADFVGEIFLIIPPLRGATKIYLLLTISLQPMPQGSSPSKPRRWSWRWTAQHLGSCGPGK
mmetsp:Transcript_4840/g.13473  ORF Transcript_4840/g.13473 Transcript_4840/m.13473 type:complete len:178 (-) Transcript_4840:207-740(-)